MSNAAQVRPATSKVLVIFDLNGTLCSMEHPASTSARKAAAPAAAALQEPDFLAGQKRVYVRPFVHTMLEQVASEYDVACWSCNTARYALPTAKALFRTICEPKFVWTNEDCDFEEDYTTMKRTRGVRRFNDDQNVGSKNVDRPELDAWQYVVLVDDTPAKYVRRGTEKPGLFRTLLHVPEFDRNEAKSRPNADPDVALLSLKSQIDAWVDSVDASALRPPFAAGLAAAGLAAESPSRRHAAK